MSDNNVAISVKNIKKTFHLPHESQSGIKQAVLNTFKKDKKHGYEIQQVLNDISFTVEKGDFFGIVGRNGSGKSTLLKLLAGIYTPDSGEIKANGSLVPFIELGVGFNPDLTGRENIFLNGALLGFSHNEMKAMYDEIVEFAEIERFMDQKLKNYSSGMQVRLAFSIAIKAQGDVLILDEVLAVGDEAFQRKCNNFFNEIKRDKSKTVILVTHDMSAVKRFCNKAIMIHNGRIVAQGSADEVSNEYSLENTKKDDDADKPQSHLAAGLTEEVPVFEAKLLSKQMLSDGDTFECNLTYQVEKDIPVRFGISIMDTNASYPIMNDWVRTDDGGKKIVSEKAGKYTFNYKWRVGGVNSKDLTFIATLYHVKSETEVLPIAFIPLTRGASFIVNHEGKNNALLDQNGKWSLVEK